MLLKIQQTKENEDGSYSDYWQILGGVSEVTQLPPKRINDPELSGRLYTHPVREVGGEGRKLQRLLVMYEGGGTENLYFETSVFLMNDDGETIERLNY